MSQETGKVGLHTKDDKNRSFGRTLCRPFKFLATQMIIQVLAIYMAYLYGLIYIAFSTFPDVWEQVYGESIGIGGLNYISLGVGYVLGSQICGPLTDRIYLHLSNKTGTGKPEYRIPVMVPGAVLVPVGLFWYGWGVQAQTHWIVPSIGAAIFSMGTIMGFQVIQVYLIDAYTEHAASALAAVTVLRSLAGFAFPLFSTAMFKALHYGWGNSVLGFIALAIGCPAPYILWRYGERLRLKSTFAASGEGNLIR